MYKRYFNWNLLGFQTPLLRKTIPIGTDAELQQFQAGKQQLLPWFYKQVPENTHFGNVWRGSCRRRYRVSHQTIHEWKQMPWEIIQIERQNEEHFVGSCNCGRLRRSKVQNTVWRRVNKECGPTLIDFPSWGSHLVHRESWNRQVAEIPHRESLFNWILHFQPFEKVHHNKRILYQWFNKDTSKCITRIN